MSSHVMSGHRLARETLASRALIASTLVQVVLCFSSKCDIIFAIGAVYLAIPSNN